MSLTEEEILRYSRHIILPEVGGRGQKRLKSGSVLLAGLGAAGSVAALYLAAAGIGRLTLWDPGLVTAQDLEGGIAHARERVGQPRARSAAVPLRAMNPGAQVEVCDRESDLFGLLHEHQVLLATTGDWGALVPESTRLGGTAVLCSARGARGAVSVFRSGEPCLRCLGGERAAAAGLTPEEGGVPAVAAAAGVVGVVAATEAVKLLLGTGTPLTGRILRFDGWNSRFEEEYFDAQDGCSCKGA